MERVRRDAFGAQARALFDPEAVLLVDHGEPQAVELDALGQQRVRPDGQRCLARRQAIDRAVASTLRLTADNRFDAHAQRQQHRSEFGRVLRRQEFGRRHQRGLQAVTRGQHRRWQRRTSVFPLPTSPCNIRFIGTLRAMSRQTSETTRRCAPVIANGSAASNSASKPGSRQLRVDPAYCGV